MNNIHGRKSNFLTESLINRFRDQVNTKDFVYFKYNDVDGKSHWNAICSCMDWLTVAIRSINILRDLPKDIDAKSMHMFSLISYIDIVNESITTLHSVITCIKGRENPFTGDKSVFKGIEGKDDNTYFSELRARFVAHPVNLKDSGSGERFFASWPHESFEGHDLTVMLYSNLKGGKDRQIHVNKVDLIEFASIRYQYLNTLFREIQCQYIEFTEWCKKTTIETSSDPLMQIDILLQENKRRLNSEHIEYLLMTVKRVLSVKIDNESLRYKELIFKEKVRLLIDEIYEHLQNAMFDVELTNDSLLSVEQLYKRNNYVCGKFLSCLLSERYDDTLLSYYFDTISKLDNWGYGFNMNDDSSLSLLKLYLLNEDLKHEL